MFAVLLKCKSKITSEKITNPKIKMIKINL
jgi:hypothetical protein